MLPLYGMIYRKFFFLFFFNLLSGGISAQESWSLKQCIDQALKGSLRIKQADLSIRQSSINLLQARSNVLPSINAQFQNFYNNGKTIDRFTNTFANATVQSMNMFAGSQLTLFNGLQNYQTIRQNEHGLAASRFDAGQVKNDVALSVANAYLQVLLSLEVKESAEQQASLTRQQVERAQKLVDAGVSAKGNLLQTEAQLAAEELAVVTAGNALNMARLNLVQLLELPEGSNIEIQRPQVPEPSQSLLPSSAQDVYASAMKIQPSVRSAEERTVSARHAYKASRGAALPSLQLNASLGTGYSGLSRKIVGFETPEPILIGATEGGVPVYTLASNPITSLTPVREQFSDNVNRTYGFTLSLPVFNNLQVRNRSELSRVQVEQAELTLQQSKRQLQKDVEQAFLDAVSALQKYNAAKKSLLALEENFRYAQQRFDAGAINAFEYNDGKTRLAKSKYDLIQARYEFTFRLKILDYYQGRELTL